MATTETFDFDIAGTAATPTPTPTPIATPVPPGGASATPIATPAGGAGAGGDGGSLPDTSTEVPSSQPGLVIGLGSLVVLSTLTIAMVRRRRLSR